jgi:hypothetical protein
MHLTKANGEAEIADDLVLANGDTLVFDLQLLH